MLMSFSLCPSSCELNARVHRIDVGFTMAVRVLDDEESVDADRRAPDIINIRCPRIRFIVPRKKHKKRTEFYFILLS